MATYNEALAASMEYFGGNPDYAKLPAEVYLSKYALTAPDGTIMEPTPDAMHKRLAREFARIESCYKNGMSEDEIYSLFKDFRYVIPQGSPMAGIGNPYYTVSLSNCFVVDDVRDSYAGIHLNDEYISQICKRRGGIGFDISPLRPKGTATNNAARTSDGIGVFMERFSNSTREVAQSGRRGALMLSISVHHPDIRTFIKIKHDKKKVTGANVSIRLSDEFMDAVKKDEMVQLRWPVDNKVNPQVQEFVRAKEIWKDIVHAAWEDAEPGLMYWDTILRNSPADAYGDFGFRSISSNPCQPAWATVLTPAGIRTMGDLKIGDTIWSGKQWTTVTNKVETGVKPVFAYTTRAGTFYGTENHRVVSAGEKIEVGAADSIDTCMGGTAEATPCDPADVLDGMVFGDGMVHKASNSLVLLCVGQKDQSVLTSEVQEWIGRERFKLSPFAYEVKTTLRAHEVPKTYDREVPARFLHGDARKVRGFLRGLYSANGSVVANRVTLKTASPRAVIHVQTMLSSVGISSYYTVNKEHSVKFSNGEYMCRESYDVNIGPDRHKFLQLIGFVQPDKQTRLLECCERAPSGRGKSTYEIVSTQLLGEEPVYDITVDAEEHTYWTGGLLVSNCSEITMCADDSCRLMVINVLAAVKNPFTPQAAVDWDLLSTVARKSQRLMDDLVDLEIEAVDKILAKIYTDPEPAALKAVEKGLWERIRAKALAGRRTGLGPTAIGDTIAAMGFRYGSPESVALVERVYETIEVSAWSSSIQLAKERGAFGVFNHKVESAHVFTQGVVSRVSAETRKDYEKHGRRNIAITTTAPVGSVSLLTNVSLEPRLFGTTSGIEPAFLVQSKRFRKINPSDHDAKVDRVDDMGDKWTAYVINHPAYEIWTQLGKQIPDPYKGALANDVDWEQGVALQAAAQLKNVDHSISRTCNLPRDVSEDVVAAVYMKGWEAGLKGLTVYRDGSRDGVLLSVDDDGKGGKKESFPQHRAPKRPQDLPCEVHHVKVKGEPWTVIVGLMDGKPYELFGGKLSEAIKIPKSVSEGVLVKVSHGKSRPASYDLKSGEHVFTDITAAFENPTEGSFTRAISVALRHGADVKYVVEQIQKGAGDSDLHSLSKVLARALKHHIKDGAKASDKVCKACGAEELIYKEGCVTCAACSWSKC